MSRHVIIKPLAVAGVLSGCAFAVPAASAQQDFRSPDARPMSHPPIAAVDVRSPDAKDAAASPTLRSYRTPIVVEMRSSSGFDWGDAGIGAGGMLGLVAIAAGGTFVVTHRRQGRADVSPAAG
ncbi:MAG: hypothetical protein ACJ77L_06535 [Solirubrobacteraceae bacterium]